MAAYGSVGTRLVCAVNAPLLIGLDSHGYGRPLDLLPVLYGFEAATDRKSATL